ncbi:hypothetical protein [Tessaracoccus palaemonis]|uniref:Sugar nucleotide-binding protein n=1 Tax=Tessaracoccus palaemonis TaxID=2829499 RepID=A0ABX8SQK0_9ACTN|nr:hypothetical protein [Tessaracoccus palaemonis]QXT63479.1 sugar nucleotide-binding protein [Tessaracoccus palaemonis]
MRALVLGARGAVGRVVTQELRRRGHTVTPAGRAGGTDSVAIDLASPAGLSTLAERAPSHDVVINASGIEAPAIAEAAGGTILIDISATASYLDNLAHVSPVGQPLVLGAGLVPGLSTIMLSSLDSRPGDDLDLAVVLGGGEQHGTAAVDWTANLAGHPLFAPPEGGTVLNFREGRRLPGPSGERRHLRADFPDHLLIGTPHGLSVRTYLATDSRISTAALGIVGRLPRLRGLVRHAPHLGGAGWSLTALNRRTGQKISARGEGQSLATGILTAQIAEAASRLAPSTAVTAADLLTLDDIRILEGMHVH